MSRNYKLKHRNQIDFKYAYLHYEAFSVIATNNSLALVIVGRYEPIVSMVSFQTLGNQLGKPCLKVFRNF